MVINLIKILSKMNQMMQLKKPNNLKKEQINIKIKIHKNKIIIVIKKYKIHNNNLD